MPRSVGAALAPGAGGARCAPHAAKLSAAQNARAVFNG